VSAPGRAPADGPGELDLRGVPCPLNWVRTRLALEGMAVDEALIVRLDSAEALENVPRSAREDGYAVEVGVEHVRIVRR
jgi:TusA-related sulfurtransferase